MSNDPLAKSSSNIADWTFLTNHAHVVICLAQHPNLRVKEIAGRVGITERGVLKILAELESGGVITRIREGRTNRYTVDRSRQLRHPVERHCQVGDLLRMVLSQE
jgi:DNA-binding MarR family transcriptional regulator